MSEQRDGIQLAIEIPQGRIREFCQRWGIAELSLFGSVLREDFGPQSDVDVLVTFAPGVRHGLIDVIEMEEELKQIFGREVDLITRRGVELSNNPVRKKRILESAEVLYAAG